MRGLAISKINMNEEILGRLVQEELSDADKIILERWKAESAGNAALYDELLQTLAKCKQLALMESIDTTAAMRKVKRKIKVQSRWKQALRLWQRATAILIIPIILFSAYLYIDTYRLSKELAWSEVSTPYGMSSKVTLPDGTQVELNGRSSLKYPPVFYGNKREVELSGEAFFQVKSNPKKPFVVQCRELQVEAVGTAFNVLELESGKVISSLLEGKVNVYRAKNQKQEKLVSLKPGQSLQYDCSTHEVLHIDHENIDKYLAWRENKLIFRGDLLPDLLEQLGRRYHVRFELDQQVDRQHAFTGTFIDKNLEQILSYIEQTTPIVFLPEAEKPHEPRLIRVVNSK